MKLAKELQTTRLDAYNSLSRLQEMGIVTATADRPMLFSSLRVDEALQHIIEMRRRQLDNLEEGFNELSKGIMKQTLPTRQTDVRETNLVSPY